MNTATVMMVVMCWWLWMMCHNGSSSSGASYRSDDGGGNGLLLMVVLLLLMVQRRLLMTMLIATGTDHRGGRPGYGSRTATTVVEMMETVEVVTRRIRSHPDAVRWRHSYGRAMRVELIGERDVQFRYSGHDRADAASCRVDVILSRS